MTTKTQRIHLLNDCEQSAIYNLPCFTDAKRHHYFYLNSIEEKKLKRLRLSSRVHFILQLGFFRAMMGIKNVMNGSFTIKIFKQ